MTEKCALLEGISLLAHTFIDLIGLHVKVGQNEHNGEDRDT